MDKYQDSLSTPGPAPSCPPGFHIEQEQHENAIVLRFTGDFDASAAPAAQYQCEQALKTAPAGGKLIVTLNQLDFLDSTGVSTLLKMRQLVLDHQLRPLFVLGHNDNVRKVLEIVGLRATLAGPSTLNAALEAE